MAETAEATSYKENINQVKCGNCGATMEFDPKEQTLKCAFCQTCVPIIKDSRVEEIALDFSSDTRKWNAETHAFHCKNCGAETVLAKDEFAKNCIFCGSASVVEVEDLDGIRPNTVIPFQFDLKEAKEIFFSWTSKKFFVHPEFKRQRSIEDFKAVYAPSWTFDSQTYSNYNGTVGDYYYVTVKHGKTTSVQRRVRYRSVAGRFDRFYDDMHINSGRELSGKFFLKLMPFDLKKAVVYSPEFLQGYMAEHYNVGLKEGWEYAKSNINSDIDSSIRKSIRADEIVSLNVSTKFSDITYKYLLLPVYTLTKKFKDKVYKFFVNGSNGRVAGSAPLSAKRILGVILGAVAGVAAIAGGILLYNFFAR